jgi:hypothetical protein
MRLAQSRYSASSALTRASTATLGSVISLSSNLKHKKACKILLAALRSSPNFQDALKAHDVIWKADIKRVDPHASSIETDIMEYAWGALNGDNPIKIARIGQIVATETSDMKLAETLVMLVDRVIVSDEEYFGTQEGLECAFHQSKVWLDVGEMHQSWWVPPYRT